MPQDTATTSLESCYPAGAPADFPTALFAPTEGSSLVIREARMRQKIDQLQACMLDMPQADTPVKNTFSGGVYAREVFIPKGTVAIGKVHVTEHLNICLQGDLTFLTVDGPRRIKAPAMFSAPAGTKKLAYANEDSVWVNVHPAICDDPDQIVDALTVSTFADFDRLVSKADMEYKVSLFGYTPEAMHKLSADESTLDASPLEGVVVRDSPLHGLGLFATQDFQAGEVICAASSNGRRTLAGRYSNHSHEPNCAVAFTAPEFVLVALRGIEAGEELTTDYGHSLAVISESKERT